MNTDDDLLTNYQVCDLLDVTPNTLAKWANLSPGFDKHLPVQRSMFDNRPVLRYRWSDIVAFLARPANEKYAQRVNKELAFDHLVDRLADYQQTVAVTKQYLQQTSI